MKRPAKSRDNGAFQTFGNKSSPLANELSILINLQMTLLN
jgi:hypothetical protein